MEHKNYKISKESVDKVASKKLGGYVELTNVDSLSLGKSLQEWISEAYETAMKEDIKANTVVLSEHFVKVNQFPFIFGGYHGDIPPMICGLEIQVSNEFPLGYDFSLVEVPMTEREKLIAETRADTVRKMQERLKYTLCINNEENTELFDYAYTLETIDQIAKEIIEGETK